LHYANENTPRVLFLDIETKPAIIASFGIRDQHISHKQILENGGTICVGVGWGHENKVRVLSTWEHGYRPMLDEVHRLISEADAVCTYNGASFDMPKLMGNFLLEAMPPPPPPTQIDIYKAVRKMGFICNKLDYVAPLLGLGGKVKHDGLEMWLSVMDGDPKAQRKMARYCAGDVRLLKQVYERIRPYIYNHPHLHNTPPRHCGSCGSSHVHVSKYRRTKASKIQQLHCQSCGSYFDGKRESAA
jgi:uncharacterized protein YprB with RNaseH-like and TPR domain